jgi:HAD superfamily hydrolase (TIGR01509 family)
MPLDAIILDVDGTLAETEELHRHAFNLAFAAAGLAWEWDPPLYARLLEVTGGKERIAHFIASHGGRPVLDAAAIADLHRAKTGKYAAAVAGGAVALRPGVRRLLDEARKANIKVAIATTTTPANVTALLHASLGPEGPARFAVIVAGDCVAAKKPAPDVYHLALQRLGVAAAHSVAIEDSVNGLRSAHSAGIKTIITRSLYGGGDGFDDAAVVLDHLGDPGTPCHVLKGPPLPGGMLTVAALSALGQA